MTARKGASERKHTESIVRFLTAFIFVAVPLLMAAREISQPVSVQPNEQTVATVPTDAVVAVPSEASDESEEAEPLVFFLSPDGNDVAASAENTETSATTTTGETTTEKKTSTTARPTTKQTTVSTTAKPTTTKQTTASTTTTTTTTKATTTTTTKKASAVWGTSGEMKSDCISIAKGLGYEYDASLGKSNSYWITPTYSGAFTSSSALKAKIKDVLQTYQTVGYTYCNFGFESNGEGEYYIYIFVG